MTAGETGSHGGQETEFRSGVPEGAVRIVGDGGKPIAQVAKNLGISETTRASQVYRARTAGETGRGSESVVLQVAPPAVGADEARGPVGGADRADPLEPIIDSIARHASALLADAGLHGHKHAIDAMLAPPPSPPPDPSLVLTSDPEDLTTLCGTRVTVVKIRPTTYWDELRILMSRDMCETKRLTKRQAER